jgi:lipid-A-disaccharide synthase
MTPVYGETIARLLRARPDLDVAIPVAPQMEGVLKDALRGWPVAPRLVAQGEKFAAFRAARAALVTSGVATLELALAGTPMAVAYKVSPLEWPLRHLVRVDSIVLPNLILGENIVPEYLQDAAHPQALAEAVSALLAETAARERQLAAFTRLRATMRAAGDDPAARAAAVVLEYV